MSVGVAEIDHQHRQLLESINSLHDAVASGEPKDVIGGMITRLEAYARTHFSTEEKYFDRFDYPETVVHRMEHGAFVEQVSGFRKRLDERSDTLPADVLRFLLEWLMAHIKVSDKRYGPLLKKNGLE